MSKAKMRSLTITSKGQVTISARARKLLGLDKGDHLIELVIGNCVILMPENRVLNEATRQAHKALNSAGVTVEELLKEAEQLKEDNFIEKYPKLI